MILRRRRASTGLGAPPAPHDDQVRARLAAARGVADATPGVLARLDLAPAGYVLTQSSSDLARHAALLEPRPAAEEVRILVTPGRAAGTWNLDVATFDRPGLLARVAGALLHAGVDVVQAVVATWEDGAALQALVVSGAVAPDATELQAAIAWSLEAPLAAPPVAGAVVAFDPPSGSYTGCEVVAADRPGLLHAIAVAIALAGADIHAARVATEAGTARDRFDLTDQQGRPLAPGARSTIADHLRNGAREPVPTRRPRP